MKWIFVVNPTAGKEDKTLYIKEMLAGFKGDFSTYTTKSRGDAQRFVASWCEEHSEDTVFVACGGDGTLNEVCSGAIGHENAIVTVFPCGSGNDYVKYYGGKDAFLDIGSLINGKETAVDMIKVNDRWAINACHFGLDSYVAEKMIKIRRAPLIGGKNAYTTAVLGAFVSGMKTGCSVEADGELLSKKELLLCTMCCGTHVGGSYKSAPRSLNDDGLLEVTLFKPVSRLRFIKLVDAYKEGRHLEDPRFRDILTYKRAKKAVISAPSEIAVSLDGEIIRGTRFSVEIVPKKLRFMVPEKASIRTVDTEGKE